MGCMPESGGCERHRADPFVNYLNEITGSQFSHRACLDRMHRNSPHPEALYSDLGSGGELVMSVRLSSGPSTTRHATATTTSSPRPFRRRSARSQRGGRCRSTWRPAPLMPRAGLSAWAREIASSVNAEIDGVLAGRTIGSRSAGRRWSCLL